MTTTAPRIKAGGLPPTQLHRVDASLLSDNRTVMVAADVESKYVNSPMPYTEIEEADEDGPPEMIAYVIVMVLAIGSISIWMIV